MQTTKPLSRGISKLKSPLSMKTIEFIGKNYITQKTTNPNGFSGEFDQTFKEEIITILHKRFRKFKKMVCNVAL